VHTLNHQQKMPPKIAFRVDLPGGRFVEDTQAILGRLLSTVLRQADYTPLNAHAYDDNVSHQRTKQTFTADTAPPLDASNQ
jgi:hypothetical protein